MCHHASFRAILFAFSSMARHYRRPPSPESSPADAHALLPPLMPIDATPLIFFIIDALRTTSESLYRRAFQKPEESFDACAPAYVPVSARRQRNVTAASPRLQRHVTSMPPVAGMRGTRHRARAISKEIRNTRQHQFAAIALMPLLAARR